MNNAQPSQDRLALLYHLSQTFNSSLDLDEVLNRVIDEVIVATRAERGFVMLRNEDSKLNFRVARGIDQTTIGDPAFQISRSVVERVANQGEPILTSDAQSDVRFSMRQSVMILGLRSILCVPLKVQQRILGVIYVDNRMQAGIFTHSDLDLLNAIASSAAVAIENARLYHVAVEKGRLERELQVARQVQASLLPREAPQFEGWEFVARWLPARQVAGDYYDFIAVHGNTPWTASLPTGDLHPADLGVVIADVTDKGMPAALFMALTRSIVRASVDRAPSPAEGIRHANQLICADSPGGMFVTLFYATLNPESGQVNYVNAGHNPPLFYQAGERKLSRLTRTGMALGIDETVPYTQRDLQMGPGDFILFYTDGVTDAFDEQEHEFGMERLERVLLSAPDLSGPQLVDRLENEIRQFTGERPLYDDITIVFARRVG